jgi:hypothetical protein
MLFLRGTPKRAWRCSLWVRRGDGLLFESHMSVIGFRKFLQVKAMSDIGVSLETSQQTLSSVQSEMQLRAWRCLSLTARDGHGLS